MTPDETHNSSEEALRTKGQRQINRVWEITQASIAILVTATTLFVSAMMVKTQSAHEAFAFLTNVFFVVIGFYFGRTNHQRTGGVGGAEAGARS
jgi:hypothetical protein